MLEKSFDRKMEEKWRKYWAENNVYKFDKSDNEKPIYSIDTPPPFTSGELHMGHVLSYSYFDFVARYKRMRGFNVYYPQGWDTQGFPTEVRVEKKYGRPPPEEFRKKCVEWTGEFIERMRKQMDELGFSPDWDYEYRTMDPEYHRKIQLSLIKMYDDKLVYRGEYPVYWCTKCASAIAKAELDDVEKSGQMNHIKFQGPEGEDLIIATTRPELLPACVAVLYNPEDERYKNLKGKKVKTALGKEVPVFEDKEVDMEFGTGLLMVCTFGDKMDVVWMHRYKLPIINAINKYGKMINSGEFDGLKVKEAKKKIIEKLESEGKVVKKEDLQQTVKVHDRCGTPIELLTSMQWFADIKSKGKEVKDFAKKIKWVPDFGISYLTDWVEGAEWDWVISRQRIFGTPLPFYYCEKCGETEKADEKDLPFYAEKAKEKKCKCGENMAPETSVCDCWVDSSITPLIIAGWPEEMKLYPSSLRPQGVEIVRTWAFYTIYRCGALTGKPPFETILLNGNVLAPDGKKMSKSLGNVISPADLLKDYPVDAIRQWGALSGAMAKDRPFSYEDIRYSKSFLIKLWNASRFVEKSIEDYDGEKGKQRMTDRWVISRMNQVIKEFTEYMDRYEFHHAMNRLHSFFWHDFCDNYLEYVKYRIYNPEIFGEDSKKAAQHSLKYVIYNVLKLTAPISCYITEEIFSEMFKEKKSIHISKWPEPGEIDEETFQPMEQFNEIVSKIRQHKASNRMSQNTELEKVTVTLKTALNEELKDDLKNISKIKKLEIKEGEFSVEFYSA